VNERCDPNEVDFRLDVPALARANAEIWLAAAEMGDLDAARSKVFEVTDVPPQSHKYRNLAFMVGQLYCLLLVPKELLRLKETHPIFAELDKAHVSELFVIETRPNEFDEAPSYWLLRLLRNSLAHVLFRVGGDNIWEFWTERKPKWKATTTTESLWQVLMIAGTALGNHALAQRPKPAD